MKGLSIYTIIASGTFIIGMMANLVDGQGTGYTIMAIAMMVPILIFAIMYTAKPK
jgi:hypothetical protein